MRGSYHVRMGVLSRPCFLGVSPLIGYYTMLRTGKLLGLLSSHLLCQPSSNQVLISLGLAKSGKRAGAKESVILGFEPAIRRLVKQWKALATASTPLARSPASWRGLFNESLRALKLDHHGFRPYSLRWGGATFWLTRHQSLDHILVSGRCQTQKSARIYINEGLAWPSPSDSNDRFHFISESPTFFQGL